MAYTALHRLPGIALVVSQGTTTPVAIAAFEDISIDVELEAADATAANAAFEQLVATRKKGNGALTGFIGADFPLLNVGDAFAVTIAEGANTVSGALAQASAIPGKCRVTKVSDKFNKDPAKVTVTFRYGFID